MTTPNIAQRRTRTISNDRTTKNDDRLERSHNRGRAALQGRVTKRKYLGFSPCAGRSAGKADLPSCNFVPFVVQIPPWPGIRRYDLRKTKMISNDRTTKNDDHLERSRNRGRAALQGRVTKRKDLGFSPCAGRSASNGRSPFVQLRALRGSNPALARDTAISTCARTKMTSIDRTTKDDLERSHNQERRPHRTIAQPWKSGPSGPRNETKNLGFSPWAG